MLVMSEEQLAERETKLMSKRGGLWARWRMMERNNDAKADAIADEAMRVNEQIIGVRELHAAMTPIDIPDGCVLAVVAEDAARVATNYPNVATRLVTLIQEVKL